MDKTYFRERIPKIQIYNGPAEKLDTSVRSYFQFPAYKTLNIGYGGGLNFKEFYMITAQKIGLDSYLMIQIDGEQEARAFNLSKVTLLPLTIEIQNRGRRALVTIEQVKDTGIQLRTFLAKQ